MTLLALTLLGSVTADPCGMVPPIAAAPGAIQRDGAQRTYVMHSRGMETLALRPGFVGDVDAFGMLIPFLSVPTIRKIEDDTFAHIEAAIDPPTVPVRIYDPVRMIGMLSALSYTEGGGGLGELTENEDGLGYMQVNVVREEAVGMYQVAVLEAGSPRALDAWMSDNGYRYPEGMDDVVRDYVQSKWCFVAVKAAVGGNDGASPRPGMRDADTTRPAGSSFDGHVQGMAFRFESAEPVVPMRLSVFNGEDPRNVVYMLTDDPVRMDDVSTDLVVRQVTGEQLYSNLTEPLPVQWLEGSDDQLSTDNRALLDAARDPATVSGAARVLFSADLLAARTGQLSLDFETDEKELLRISEAMNLRGAEVDTLHLDSLSQARELAVDGALDDVKEMHLSVLDGTFDGAVLARQNLGFSPWTLSEDRNTPRKDAIRPTVAEVTLYLGQ
jgi:hypothetical protein